MGREERRAYDLKNEWRLKPQSFKKQEHQGGWGFPEVFDVKSGCGEIVNVSVADID